MTLVGSIDGTAARQERTDALSATDPVLAEFLFTPAESLADMRVELKVPMTNSDMEKMKVSSAARVKP